MSLKIQNNISSIKINGHYIKQAKLNGYIVYELKDEETSNYTIAENWVGFTNGSVDGTLIRDNLDVWVTGTKIERQLQGLLLTFTITGKYNLKATFEFTGYEGCPRYQTCYIINNDDGSMYEFTMYFDEAGTNFTRTINQVLETGNYGLLVGSFNNMDFGVKCTEVSLSTEIPQNLFDLSNYSFPITQNGLTIDYDNVKKSLIINGKCTSELNLSIPLSIPRANYTFSYQEMQQDLGFHLALDRAYNSILDGWGNNNATFDVYDTSDELLLLFEAGYTYNNLELSFNLVKNHDLPEPV